jgi:putative NADH-flavin reductase
MKLIVFGATGGTGQQVVTQALAQGHTVTAFVRRPEAVTTQHANLRIVQGDITDPTAVDAAVAGHDVVLSTLGTRGGPPALVEGTHNILVAMEQAGIRRNLWVSSFGVSDSQQQMGWIARTVIVNVFLKNAIAEKEIQERYIRESTGDWIIARPGGLTEGPLTESYRCVIGPDEKVGRPSISRADVADFLLKNLTDTRYVRRAVGLTY